MRHGVKPVDEDILSCWAALRCLPDLLAKADKVKAKDMDKVLTVRSSWPSIPPPIPE